MEGKEKLKRMKEQVLLTADKVYNVSDYEHPSTFQEDITPLSLKSFIENLDIHILSSTPEELVVDVKGIDAPLANALRRIMIAEVPTMAIEIVTMYQNTSIIPDEVLAHRLGLIPILADPLDFVAKDEHSEYNETNAIKFSLKVKCVKAEGKNINEEVLSNQLKWIPIGAQGEKFKHKPLKTVHDDILIAKLRPGQEIEAEMHCEKGIGQTHAKWSPVATAFYRLLPCISFKGKIEGEDAIKLKEKCPMGVFDIEDVGTIKTAVVKDVRKCTTCRECLRHFPDKLILGKMKNHFEFHIETVGALKPGDIFLRACQTLKDKVNDWMLAMNDN